MVANAYVLEVHDAGFNFLIVVDDGLNAIRISVGFFDPCKRYRLALCPSPRVARVLSGLVQLHLGSRDRAAAIDGFAFTGNSLCFAIAYRYRAYQLRARFDQAFAGTFTVCEHNPAGVKSKLLGFQHYAFGEEPNAFLQVIAWFSTAYDVIGHAAELAVAGHHAGKSLGLVKGYFQLQVPLFVGQINFGLQCFAHAGGNGLGRTEWRASIASIRFMVAHFYGRIFSTIESD